MMMDADAPENHIYFDVGDITRMEVDAIVNAANKSLPGVDDVDGAIHRAAGSELFEKCCRLGGCVTGETKITRGGRLKAKYVVHTVSLKYRPNDPKYAELLRDCYISSPDLARHMACTALLFWQSLNTRNVWRRL